jgi:5-(carboxyamino)imidazole ribonucleotide mutase
MAGKVAIIMGSESDWKIMQAARQVLRELGVECHAEVVSAHRTPDKMFEFAKAAKTQGYSVIIAGAGGAAHLPGMVASLTTLPVVGVPIKSSNSLDGWDSILSILQMPAGIPVATVALDNAKNAGLLAAQILAVTDSELSARVEGYRAVLSQKVKDSKLPD